MARPIDAVYESTMTRPGHSSAGASARAQRSANGYAYRAMAAQERFWLQHELHPSVPVCNEAVVLWLEGALDRDRLRAALDRLVEEHDALRTRFVQRAGVLYAEVEPESTTCPFDDSAVIDCDKVSHPLHTITEAQLTRFARARFDLTRAPLLRAGLFRESAERHALVLVAHQAALDTTSLLELIPRELGAFYGADDHGSSVSARLPQITYAELAERERASESGIVAASKLQYWRELMAGAPRALALPVDRKYPPRPSMRGTHAEHRLDGSLRARVDTLASALGVEPSDVTRAAFAALLMRYAGESDIVLGSASALRGEKPELAPLLGRCTYALLLRARFTEAPSFEQLARELAGQRRDNAERAVPFAALVEALGGGRDLARGALTQATFDHLGSSLDDGTFNGLKVCVERLPLATAAVDLRLEITERSMGYHMLLTGNADVLDCDHLDRMLSHFTVLLDHALDAPETPITALRTVGLQELESLRSFSRGPRHAGWESELFHVELWRRGLSFERSAALQSGDKTLTYAQLYERVADLGERLIAAGVTPGDFVLVPTLSEPIDTVVGMLGVLAAGGAFVPLDTSSPLSRQQIVIEDSGARFALGERSGVDVTLPAGIITIRIDELTAHSSARRSQGMPSAMPSVRGLTPEHPAYLLYTSGSTGKPKGVIVRHRNLTHQLHARLERYDDGPGRVLAPYSFAFDSALASLSWALAVGGELHLLSAEARQDVDRIEETMTRERITHLDAVPSLYGALLTRAHPQAFPALRAVICGGEALPSGVVEKHWKTLPHTRLFNEYGPTEATVFATVHELTKGVIDPSTPIGKPIANCDCWVLDAAGNVAPIGHGGELYIGGAGVTRGYHNRPLETAKRFLQRALGPDAEVVLYRTGDRCRYREDGVLEYLGRVDDQVQIRGHRVELAEVEAALCSLPGVADAAVVLLHDERGDARLVAYIVAADRQTLKSSSISTQLRELVPSYMVPSSYVAVNALPRNANGKTDRAALPELSEGAIALTSSAPPRTSFEHEVIAIFEELIGTSGINGTDNFFDQGGHSLLAVHALDLIEKRLGAKLAIADFAREPTARAIARLIDGTGASHTRARCIDVIHDHGEGVSLVFVGSVAQARRVAQHLSPNRKVFGLNLFGLHEPGKVRAIDIDWLVDQYIAELRTVQPFGPYAIGGYCDDAKVAIAMGEKLRAAGEDVRLLVLVDALFFIEGKLASGGAPIRKEAPTLSKKRARLSWLAHRVERLVRYGYDDLRRSLAGRELDFRKRLGLPLPLVLEHSMLFHNYRTALDAYRVPAIDERVALYISEEWGLHDRHISHLRGVAIRQIPGFHETMFDARSLEELASAIERDLAHADTLAPPPRRAIDVLSRGKERLAVFLPFLADLLGYAVAL